MKLNESPVIVVGGGIGGLALAMGLAQKAIPCVVLEKTPRLGEIGAGIQLAPNAFHAFDYLGVGDAARDLAVYIDDLLLMDALTGDRITRIPLGEVFRRRFRNPYAVVHRSDLHDVLLSACKDHGLVELRAGSGVERYEQDAQSVTAILESGKQVKGRGLVGADGLWSTIRQQVAGDGDPRVSGHTTYRSVIPAEQMPEEIRWNAATLWAGPKCHIVHYPLKGGDAYNLVATCHNDAPEPIVGKSVGHDEVRQGFEHIAPIARQIVDCATHWKLWVLCDREPIMNWVDDKVCLLGDAAHPMLQYFAQGACMAMEDAVCLAAEMDSHGTEIGNAFAAYNQRRVLRTTRVQLQSRAIGDHIYHPSGAHAALRNAVMSARTPQDWYDQIDWLYGSTGLEGAVSAETRRAGSGG
ncbi:MAG: 3-hydroxybenzoate 6-monooxygenase [Acidiferrobacterales bacterium]|nr:3-hydroxybenzoate 6-monooxygenase [Acidiferrobacterales bacterium]